MGTAYTEYRTPAGLEPLVACLWENTTMLHRLQPIVPDACLDLVWQDGAGLLVVGADTGPRLAGPVGEAAIGIRLRAAAAGAVLGMPASEVVDQQVAADDVWGAEGRRLASALRAAEADQRLRLLTETVLRRHAEPDPLVAAAGPRLSLPGARVSRIAADLGVSERQLHRRVQAAVGYGPKMLARVGRLRRLIAARDDSLAARALVAGYASQSHMNAEVRRLTGLTPVRFLKDATLTAA